MGQGLMSATLTFIQSQRFMGDRCAIEQVSNSSLCNLGGKNMAVHCTVLLFFCVLKTSIIKW